MGAETTFGRMFAAAAGALLAASAGLGQVVISEFVAVNNSTLADEDGSYPDWIEVYNEGAGEVNLEGWYLTDRAGNLTKWRFPRTMLGAGEYLVVFASNKDRAVPGEELHTDFKLGGAGEYLALVEPDGITIAAEFAPEYPPQAADISYGLIPSVRETTLVSTGGVWSYHEPQDGTLGTTWTSGGFDDSSWSAGAAGLGFDSGTNWQPYIVTDVAAAMTRRSTLYMRIPFVLDAVSGVQSLTFRARYNDGFVAYINGEEVARANAPDTPTWDSIATNVHGDTAVETFAVQNPSGVLVAGTNVLAVHAMNVHPRNGDFLIAPELRGNVTETSLADAARVYFLTPTPGEANGDGTPELGPLFVDATDTVIGLQTGETFAVTTRVVETLYPVETVRVAYRAMFGGESTLVLRDDGVAPDATAGDDLYTGSLTLSGVAPGEMFRWRFEAADDHAQTTSLPRFADPLDSPAYFGTMARDDSIESRLPVIHWFVETPSAANNTTGTRGCLWFLDRFYDNVHFSLHGQSTRGFPKKSYNVDFNRGERFRYREGQKTVKDIDFLTNWADKSKSRNTIAYAFYTDSGHPAHFSFPARLQQNGQFFSVTDVVEDGDERYTDRVGLDPDGALYKMYNKCNSATSGAEKKTRKDEDRSDLTALVAGLDPSSADREAYAYDHVDIPRAVNYLASHVIVNNRDHGHKNYYLYRDTDGNGEWSILHWDVDLCLGHVWTPRSQGGHAYFDDTIYVADEVVYSSGNRFYDAIYNHPETRAMVLRRVRTLMDTFLKPAGTPEDGLYFEPQVAALLELIDPEPGESDADRDLAKWGNWGNMDEMTTACARIVNEFLPGRRTFLYDSQTVGNGGEIPAAQPSDAGLAFGQVEYLPDSGNQDEEFIELVNTNDYAVDISGWSLQGGVSFTFRGGTVLAAGQSLYVSPDVTAFRSRSVSPTGGEKRFVQGKYKGQLADKGEHMALVDNAGREVGTYSYEGFTADYTGGLRVTEIMFNPTDPEAEFVELFNAGGSGVDLTDVVLTGGIAFDFRSSGKSYLGVGEYCVVVRNLAAFTNRYGGESSAFVAGVYTGHLDNAGDTLKVADTGDEAILFDADFEDRRGWPQAANGAGHSLVPLVMTNQASGVLHYGGNWRAGTCRGGSPGEADPAPTASVVINELGAHTDTGLAPPYDSDDWIELYNPTAASIDIGGWFLSDRSDNLKRYQIASNTVIAGYGHLALTENLHFHTDRTSETGFGLNKAGDELYLSCLPGNSSDRVVDALRFKGQLNGESLGRHADGETCWYMLSPTPNAPNAVPDERVVISEIMFCPAGSGLVDNVEDEYIELYNPTPFNVPLGNDVGGWRIDGGVSYTFATNTVLTPGGTLLLVPFDPVTNAAALAAFKERYGLAGFEPVVLGPYDGKLSNTGERLAIEKPQAPDMPGDGVSRVIVDEVIYFAMWPWPSGARGTGKPFQRLPGHGAGNDPRNWTVPDAPSPGLGFGKITLTAPEYGRQFLLPFSTVMHAEIDPSQVSGSVHLVEFFEGNTLIAADESAPYESVYASGTSQTSFTFTARLTDDAGTSTSAVSLVSAVGPLSVQDLGVSNITDYTAELWGSFGGCDYVDATLYWGPRDGGTNSSAWAHANHFGRVTAAGTSQPIVVSATVRGLLPGSPHYYRWHGFRSGGVRWSGGSGRFDARGYSEWPHRMKIAFSGYGGEETLTNFPALVQLSPGIGGFSYEGFAFPDGRDLRFSIPGRLAPLFYEIEDWDTNGVSTVWVRVPALTADTAIRAYWGNASIAVPAPYTSDGSVWSDGFKGVWHFNDTLTDSAAEQIDAVNHGAVAVDGVAGGGLAFDGSAAYVDPGIGAYWLGGNMDQLTISVWAKPNGQHNGTVGGTAEDGRELGISSHSQGRFALWSFNVGAESYREPMGTIVSWQHLALVLDRGRAVSAFNGDCLVFSPSHADYVPARALLIGALNGETGRTMHFDGAIDEVRLSAVARSADWLEAEHDTVARAAAFARFAALPSDTDGDGLADAWEDLHLGGVGASPGARDDGDLMSNRDEYVAGTDPTNAARFFAVDLELGNGVPVVRFKALSAEGPGYEGLQRIYDLQYRSDLLERTWLPVPGCTGIVGHGQTVGHTNRLDSRSCYRAAVRLE